MKSPDVFAQFAAKALDALAVWADVNQRVMHELVNLSATTAKETGRLYGELQSSAVEAVREGQASWLRRQSQGPELPTDPLLWYQKGLVETIEGSQKALRFMETGAQALTKSAEQFQAAAERSGKEIQAALSGLATRIHDIYAAA